MSWICLIGNSERGAKAIRELGYEVGLLANRTAIASDIVQTATSIVPVDMEDEASIAVGFRKLVELNGKPAGVVSFTELGILPAAKLSVEYGLPTNPVEVVEATRDKAIMREKLKADPQLALPYFRGTAYEIREFLLNQPEDSSWIIKPVDGYGSLSVTLVQSRSEQNNWYVKYEAVEGPRWIVEAFLSGQEYSVEAVTFGGMHVILGITQKQTTSAPNFVETGHVFPAVLTAEETTAIHSIVGQALTVLGVQMGATHTEVKVDPVRGPVIIETHTRTGGDCIPELLEGVTGLDQYALGIQSTLEDINPETIEFVNRGAVAIQFFQTAPGVLYGLQYQGTLADPSLIRWHIDQSIGCNVSSIENSFTRMGYVLTRGETAQDALRHAERITASFEMKIQQQ